MPSVPKFPCLICVDSECSNKNDTKLCHNATKCWKSSKIKRDGKIHYERGCVNDNTLLDICYMSNKSYTKDGEVAVTCCAGELCNDGLFPEIPPLFKGDEPSPTQESYNFPIRLIIVVILLLGALSSLILSRRRKRKKRMSAARSSSLNLEVTYSSDAVIKATAAVGDSTVKGYLEQSITSGSGYGLPLLMQRTLAKTITLKELIGKGKYGEVWRGIRNDDEVAVKIFLSKDEASWTRETEIYNAIMVVHPNILSFIGSDMTSCNSTTQLWLITDYHALGSLYDYLNRTSLNYDQTLKIIWSIVKGINHLHEEITGNANYNKPLIAHRDIKSKNILMKTEDECVIADFGLAVTYNEKTNYMTKTVNPRVGTKRYMAPEVLDQRMNTECFESYKRADIYSLGLVFWEISWRTVIDGKVDAYKLPFFDCLDHNDPSFDEMRNIVCVDQKRPPIPSSWSTDSVLQPIMRITKECWHQKPSVRPSTLRIRRTLEKLNA